jgi:magnesium-transporting ATPase (P-type)
VTPTKDKRSAQEIDDLFWAVSQDDLLKRLRDHGSNRPKPQREKGTFGLLLSQFRGPIILIPLFAAGLSLFLGETIDAATIFVIVVLYVFSAEVAKKIFYKRAGF